MLLGAQMMHPLFHILSHLHRKGHIKPQPLCWPAYCPLNQGPKWNVSRGMPGGGALFGEMYGLRNQGWVGILCPPGCGSWENVSEPLSLPRPQCLHLLK